MLLHEAIELEISRHNEKIQKIVYEHWGIDMRLDKLKPMIVKELKRHREAILDLMINTQRE